MKLPKTLSELKRQNAQSSESEEHETETENESLQLEETDSTPESLEAGEGDEDEIEEIPAWLQTGESQDNEDGVQVPLKAHIAQRKKFQGSISNLRTDIEARDTQIEALNSTIQELKEAISPQSKTRPGGSFEGELPPALSDFEEEDNPEAAHQAAMLDWSMRTFDRRQQKAEQSRQAEQIAQTREADLNHHYTRAAQLIEAGQLTPDEYREADAFVRQAIEITRPGQGRTIFNTLFADLGNGSEKVLISLYRNPQNLSQLQRELTTDMSGIRASAFLGRLAGTFEGANSQRSISSAPAPGSRVKGDAKATTTSGSRTEQKLRKEYEKAHKSGDVQAAWSAKKKARAAGVDVSRWAYE